jgi:hypothetical protein
MVTGYTGMGTVSEFLTRGHTATRTCDVTGFLRVFSYYYFYFRIDFKPIFFFLFDFIQNLFLLPPLCHTVMKFELNRSPRRWIRQAQDNNRRRSTTINGER